ncbi:MAG: SWIM zinc finger domain-containing protein [Acidimicrobiia bacterium]|nr:SWIM zinc finger domain-containing protein [Acidimicrobiia bacterium]
MVDVLYRYRVPSAVLASDDATSLLLSTAGGRGANPVFFNGFAEDAPLAAKALLTVAEVARTRYFDPGARARSRDPVVTSNLDVLRFESFSGCNGVYARFDLDEGAVDGEFFDWGTTNVDMNQPMRTALAQVSRGEPLGVAVGADDLTVQTMDATEVEKKVPLPDRWVRGFAEVSVVMAGMRLVQEFGTAHARRILTDVPRIAAKRVGWITWTGGRARLTTRPGDDDVPLAGPERLGSLARVIPHVTGLRVYAPPAEHRKGIGGRPSAERMTVPSAWELVFDGARLALVLSPEAYRGFSGEGGVLLALSQVDQSDISAHGDALQGQAYIDPQPASRPILSALGAGGRVGFDLSRGGFFHRDLPFDRSAVETLQPRLLDARALIADGAVTAVEGGAEVRSGDTIYKVRFADEGLRCTCAWFAKHRGERGPCKHALAAALARVSTA